MELPTFEYKSNIGLILYGIGVSFSVCDLGGENFVGDNGNDIDDDDEDVEQEEEDVEQEEENEEEEDDDEKQRYHVHV